jgi:hypothetical protein
MWDHGSLSPVIFPNPRPWMYFAHRRQRNTPSNLVVASLGAAGRSWQRWMRNPAPCWGLVPTGPAAYNAGIMAEHLIQIIGRSSRKAVIRGGRELRDQGPHRRARIWGCAATRKSRGVSAVQRRRSEAVAPEGERAGMKRQRFSSRW